jgi:hypothetical protein
MTRKETCIDYVELLTPTRHPLASVNLRLLTGQIYHPHILLPGIAYGLCEDDFLIWP